MNNEFFTWLNSNAEIPAQKSDAERVEQFKKLIDRGLIAEAGALLPYQSAMADDTLSFYEDFINYCVDNSGSLQSICNFLFTNKNFQFFEQYFNQKHSTDATRYLICMASERIFSSKQALQKNLPNLLFDCLNNLMVIRGSENYNLCLNKAYLFEKYVKSTSDLSCVPTALLNFEMCQNAINKDERNMRFIENEQVALELICQNPKLAKNLSENLETNLAFLERMYERCPEAYFNKKNMEEINEPDILSDFAMGTTQLEFMPEQMFLNKKNLECVDLIVKSKISTLRTMMQQVGNTEDEILDACNKIQTDANSTIDTKRAMANEAVKYYLEQLYELKAKLEVEKEKEEKKKRARKQRLDREIKNFKI